MKRIAWKIIKWNTGLLSLYLDVRLAKQHARKPFDIVVIDLLVRLFLRRPHLQAFTTKDRGEYEATASQASYWHGTGRLQYNRKGNVIDVLEYILQSDGLVPFTDIFDVKQGAMDSISVARHRMYARIYGDMHVYRGASLSQRYGSPRFWVYYFIMGTNLHAIRELGLWRPSVRKKQHEQWRRQGKALWTIKVTQNQDGESLGQFFNEGSDIPGNYPILIGLKKFNYHTLPTSAYVARYESRIGSHIPMSAFSHLEVPADKVDEITQLITASGHSSIPVFAFESCEQLQTTKHFSELVG